MTFTKAFSAFAVVTLLANSALACNFECKRNNTLNDKTIAEPVKKELKDYYEKSEKIYKECQDKRKDLRKTLSEDAKKAMAKHHKRKDSEVKSTESATPATPQKK